MAILKAGNTEVHIGFHHYQSCGCIEYSFEPKVNGVMLFNPAANQPFCSEGVYLTYSLTEKETLIPFLERLLTERRDGKWDQFPEDDVAIEVRTWQSQKEQVEKRREGKTIWTTDAEGEPKQVPYSEGVAFLEPFMADFLEMDIIFTHRLFAGDAVDGECCDVCLKLRLSFDTLEAFISELNAEYELFRLTKMKGHDN